MDWHTFGTQGNTSFLTIKLNSKNEIKCLNSQAIAQYSLPDKFFLFPLLHEYINCVKAFTALFHTKIFVSYYEKHSGNFGFLSR